MKTLCEQMMQLGLISLATAAIATTITKGSIFATMRERAESLHPLLGKLVTCSYCTSHYVAFALVLLTRPITMWGIVANFVVGSFAAVALATLVIGLIVNLITFEADRREEIAEQAALIDELRGKLQEAECRGMRQAAMIESLIDKQKPFLEP